MNDNSLEIRKLRDGLILALNTIAHAQGSLLPEEKLLLTAAAPARAQEIRAGRSTARVVMAELGFRPTAVMADANGAPLWPSGLCGSIAHSRRHIAVAMCRIREFRSLGIDIEDGRALGRASPDVASDVELRQLVSSHVAPNGETAARLVFSAKEAIFKCQAPITGLQTLGFLDVRLEPTSNGVLVVVPGPSVPALAASLFHKTSVFFEQLQSLTVGVATLAA